MKIGSIAAKSGLSVSAIRPGPTHSLSLTDRSSNQRFGGPTYQPTPYKLQ